MPRIYTSRNDPLDFCQHCVPGPIHAINQFAGLGYGPSELGNCFEYNAPHPDYETTDYRCEKCQKELGWEDN